jgi:hypothetical protein
MTRGQNDDENREKPNRPESAQTRGDGIVRRRCGSRFERERRDTLWQIRGVAGHPLFQRYTWGRTRIRRDFVFKGEHFFVYFGIRRGEEAYSSLPSGLRMPRRHRGSIGTLQIIFQDAPAFVHFS